MENEKFTVILSIPNIDNDAINEAEKIFLSYKDKGIIKTGYFTDNEWYVTDEYSNHKLDFNIGKQNYKIFEEKYCIKLLDFIKYLKTYIICLFGVLSFIAMQHIILGIKKIVNEAGSSLENMSMDYTFTFWNRISEFFSLLPCDENADISSLLSHMDIFEEISIWGNSQEQRKLSNFESYFRFNDILKRFWNEACLEEKLFYFPIWMWWNISAILPLRPREFLLTPRKCLVQKDDKYFIRVRRDKLKGSKSNPYYKINNDYEIFEYQITKELFEQIQWYIDNTNEFMDTDLKTLFITDTHYVKWGRCKPYKSRFFSYQNMRTCLRYFYEQIIKEKYNYKIIFDKEEINLSNEDEIEFIHLGDTRHIALINLIAEGATPMIAMILAGHDNPEMSSHYYSNISTLIECRTYRQYKKMISNNQNYAISKWEKNFDVEEFVLLEGDGRCYSPKVKNHDYSDCCKTIGPSGEIGLCETCLYYRAENKKFTDSKDLYKNRIQRECENLEEIIKKVRSGHGENEEIIQVLLRLKDESYSYQKYLLETEEMKNGKS